MSNEADCRTAPATPDLLKIIKLNSQYIAFTQII